MVATRTEPLLNIHNITHRYGPKEVLTNVNAHIDNLLRTSGEVTGQVVAFLGPSGCGKTTLLRILAGLEIPTSGEVKVGPKQEPTRPGMVGLVSQNSILYRNRTVFGNLLIAAKQGGRQDPTKDAWIMLQDMGLQDLKDQYPSQLSGGQKQRVAICQQLLCSEHFLLMDEPTAGLDVKSKKKICSLISQVANQDDLNTIIIVTHDIRSAITVADTIWLMGHTQDKPGASIVDTYDLVERGLTWHPEIQDTPEFYSTEKEITKRFDTL